MFGPLGEKLLSLALNQTPGERDVTEGGDRLCWGVDLILSPHSHSESFYRVGPQSKQVHPPSTVQSSLTSRLLTFSRTKRDRVGSRKPKHELRELMTKAISAILGNVMSFQNECSPGSESKGKKSKKE